MAHTGLLSFLLLALSGLTQAFFALPVRFVRGWRWEHMWIAQSLTGNVLLPLLWASLLPSAFWIDAARIPLQTWVTMYAFGFVWGVGGAAYGFSLARVGIAITYSLTFGLTTLTAGVLPILLLWTHPPLSVTHFAAGLGLLVLGIAGSGIVGARAAANQATKYLPLPFRIRSYRVALTIVVLGGVLSAAYGLVFSLEFPLISDLLRSHVSPISAPLIVALPIYAGAASFAIPFGLVLSAVSRDVLGLLNRNPIHNWLLALAVGIAGVGGVCLFGFGSSEVGHPEPNVSFAVFISFFVLGGNLLGVHAGELRAASVRMRALYRVFTLEIVLGAVMVRLS